MLFDLFENLPVLTWTFKFFHLIKLKSVFGDFGCLGNTATFTSGFVFSPGRTNSHLGQPESLRVSSEWGQKKVSQDSPVEGTLDALWLLALAVPLCWEIIIAGACLPQRCDAHGFPRAAWLHVRDFYQVVSESWEWSRYFRVSWSSRYCIWISIYRLDEGLNLLKLEPEVTSALCPHCWVAGHRQGR